MNLSCEACGTRFRSMTTEARHRHNFPALCKRNKRFEAWAHTQNIASMIEKFDKLGVGRLFMPVWVDHRRNAQMALYVKLSPYLGLGRYRMGRCLAGTTARIDGRINPDIKAHQYMLEDAWFQNKLRLDVPSEEQEAQFVTLLGHGLWKRAFEVVGFTVEIVR
jgi:hypothetical protein